ncbi:MAG TPA: ATP-binding protein [Bellilinea sp.]|nr:ATP-binding protein [Bellilinea sp.]
MEAEYNLDVKLSVLRLLGPNLYGNVPAVLSELVANAWDADATRVDININRGKCEIEIEDNGLGISPLDINERYLSVGYEKRKTEAYRLTPSGRHVMGRKGIGKLAIFSFARVAEIHSSHALGKSGFILEWDKIEEQFDTSTYRPTPLLPERVETKHAIGTRIVLRDIQDSKWDFAHNEDKIRLQLARRFTILDGKHKFDVYINGKQITDKDRVYYQAMEFLWTLNDGFEYKTLCPRLKQQPLSLPYSFELSDGTEVVLKGWVGTVDTPKAITNDGNNVVSIYSHGKLVHEDILASYNEIKARNFATYVIGDIEADFLDDDEQSDIVIANRREVSADDPRFIALRSFILEKILQPIGARWSTMRNIMQIDQRLMSEEIQDRYDKLNAKDQEKSSSYLKRLSRIPLPVEDAQKCALIIFNHLSHLKKVKGLVSRSDNAFLEELRACEPTNSSNKASEKPNTEENGKSDDKTDNDGQGQSNRSAGAEQNDQTDNPRENQEAGTPNSKAASATSGDGETNQQGESHSGDTANDQKSTGDGTFTPVFDFPEGIERVSGTAFRKTSPPERERENLFKEIKTTLENSKIPSDLKQIALYDLRQAYWSYSIGAFKASCIMLGAVLEGVMISVVLDMKVLGGLRTVPGLPQVIQNCGITNQSVNLDEVAKRIQSKFFFEDYKLVIAFLMQREGEADKSKISEIQIFRNIIHPLKNIAGVDAYKDVDATRALNLLSSMAIICKIVTKLLD